MSTRTRSKTTAKKATKTSVSSRKKKTEEPKKQSKFLKRGKAQQELHEKSVRESEKRKERSMNKPPLRFYLKPGQEANVIILDEGIHDMGVSLVEHNMRDPQTGYWSIFEPCINEHYACPICATSDKPPYEVTMLTVLDLRPYKDKNGVTQKFSKKLLPVKQGQYNRLCMVRKSNKGLRGLKMTMSRSKDSKSPSIGDFMPVGRLSEEKLEKRYKLDQPIKNKEGKVVRDVDYFLKPFPYEEWFEPDIEDILERYGTKNVSGSSSDVDSELDDLDDLDDLDELDSLDDDLEEELDEDSDDDSDDGSDDSKNDEVPFDTGDDDDELEELDDDDLDELDDELDDELED